MLLSVWTLELHAHSMILLLASVLLLLGACSQSPDSVIVVVVVLGLRLIDNFFNYKTCIFN